MVLVPNKVATSHSEDKTTTNGAQLEPREQEMNTMIMEEAHIPLKRPHFLERDNKLFFLISKRPYLEFSKEEQRLWGKLEERCTIGELGDQFSGVKTSLERFWDLQIIELAPQLPPAGREKILIIEPHMDDAILSVGGTMWQKRNECEFSVVSVTGVSNFTSYYRIDRDYFDTETVTRLRRQESDLVMDVLGGKHDVLDQKDAPLRYQDGSWSLEWYKQNHLSIASFVNHSVKDSDVESWQTSVSRVLQETDAAEIWIPLGIGTSADHETTRNACIWALMQRPEIFKRSSVFFYHEVPYAMKDPSHIDEILSSLRQSGARLERLDNDVSDALEMKKRLISIYASQFKMSYMGPRVDATAQLLSRDENGYAEPLIRMTAPPRGISQFDLYSGKKHISELEDRLRYWVPRAENSDTITILSPMGFGCWEDDMNAILKAFPKATIEVHITQDAIDETNRFVSERVQVRPVKGKAFSWLKQILKIRITGKRPLVIFTGMRLKRFSPFINAFFLFLRPMTAPKPDYFAKALDRRHLSKRIEETSNGAIS